MHRLSHNAARRARLEGWDGLGWPHASRRIAAHAVLRKPYRSAGAAMLLSMRPREKAMPGVTTNAFRVC